MLNLGNVPGVLAQLSQQRAPTEMHCPDKLPGDVACDTDGSRRATSVAVPGGTSVTLTFALRDSITVVVVPFVRP